MLICAASSICNMDPPLVCDGPPRWHVWTHCSHVRSSLHASLLASANCSLCSLCRRGTASRVYLLLGSWRQGGRGAAAVVFDWETLHLSIAYECQVSAMTQSFAWRFTTSRNPHTHSGFYHNMPPQSLYICFYLPQQSSVYGSSGLTTTTIPRHACVAFCLVAAGPR